MKWSKGRVWQIRGLSISAVIVMLSLCGCGVMATDLVPASSNPSKQLMLTGRVHGGQQPISGASINLYTVGTSGNGSAAKSILNSGVTVTTDANGSFY